jgi:3-oxoacyl-[acyl-carrier-protein] synthase III
MPFSKILATGSYLPEQIVRNEDFTQFPVKSLLVIEEKTGVRTRRFASSSQCTSDLAGQAGKACLTSAGFDPRQVDAVILATSSPDRLQPATATRVQQLIGTTNAFCFDVNSVCSGAIFALALANSMIKSYFCKTVLVIAAEVYSKILNPADFSTYPYFGDGSGAVLLTAADESKHSIVDAILRTDGAGADVIQIPAGGTMLPYTQLKQQKDIYFKMKGKEVYQFAVEKGSQVIGQLLEDTGTDKDEVRWVIPHQANINIINELAERTGIDRDRFYVNLDCHGNTAAASVLIALDELWTQRPLQPNERLVIVAFGGGLSWGAMMIQS